MLQSAPQLRGHPIGLQGLVACAEDRRDLAAQLVVLRSQRTLGPPPGQTFPRLNPHPSNRVAMSPCGNQRSHRSSVASAAGTAQGRPSDSPGSATRLSGMRIPASPGATEPIVLAGVGWERNGSGQGSHLSRPEIQPGANPKQPNRLAFRDRPRGSLQQGFGDTAITPRLVDAVFGNGLPDLLIPEPDQSMATPPGYVMARAAKRRQGGKLQRQCLIPVRARHMIEIETAIDTPRPIHDPLRWGAPRQPCTSTYPLKLRPAILTTALPQAGRQEPRGRYRDAAEDSSSDHLSSRTSSREAARVAAGGALS